MDRHERHAGEPDADHGFYLSQRAVVRWGENSVLRPTIVVIGLYADLVGLTPSLTVILVLTALQGLYCAGGEPEPLSDAAESLPGRTASRCSWRSTPRL